jgi:hypothetical protein
LGFNFSIFQTGGGGSSGAGITKYPTVGDLPAVASDGDVGIVLDTNVLYSYDSGTSAWVVIGGPGVAITVTDTASINLDLSTNVLNAVLNIGSSTLPANTQGISLLIQPTGSTGLYGYFPAGPISEVTSTVLQFSGPGKAVGFSFGIQVNQASGSTPGYLSAADWAKFNNSIGLSSQIHTEVPLYGGTFLSQHGGITLSVSPASGLTAGYVTITGQTYSGQKAFNDGIMTKNGTGSSLAITSPGNVTAGLWWSGGALIYQDGPVTVGYWDGTGLALSNKLITFYAVSNASAVKIGATYNGVGGDYTMYWPLFQGSTNTFMMNNGTGGMTWAAATYAKTLLGISNSNFGDVTLGSFLAASSTVGATISAAQVLSFTQADQTSPGMMSGNDQTFNGVKYFNSVIVGWSGIGLPKPGGPETVYLNSPAGLAASANYMWPPSVGVTLSNMRNDGLGVMTWSQAERGNYISISAGATLLLQNRFIEVTTAGTNRVLDVGWGTGNTGVIFNVQKIDSGVGSVSIQSDRLVNGVTLFTFSSQWESHTFVDNGIGIRVIT